MSEREQRITKLPERMPPACNVCLGDGEPMALLLMEPTATYSGEEWLQPGRVRAAICRTCLRLALDTAR